MQHTQLAKGTRFIHDEQQQWTAAAVNRSNIDEMPSWCTDRCCIPSYIVFTLLHRFGACVLHAQPYLHPCGYLTHTLTHSGHAANMVLPLVLPPGIPAYKHPTSLTKLRYRTATHTAVLYVVLEGIWWKISKDRDRDRDLTVSVKDRGRRRIFQVVDPDNRGQNRYLRTRSLSKFICTDCSCLGQKKRCLLYTSDAADE